MAAGVLGAGRVPRAPGTAGSVAGLLLFAPLRSTPWLWPVLAATVALAVWSAGAVAASLRRRDPQLVVIDEVAGMGLTLALGPAGSWAWFAAAFALFRLFDILKPPPLRSLERLPGGWGIVADDLGAALYAAAALRLTAALLA